MPSESIVMQNGHETAITSGFVSSAWSVRSRFTRLSGSSSIHMRPPPAPQHMPKCLCRCISTSSAPALPRTARGSSYTSLKRP